MNREQVKDHVASVLCLSLAIGLEDFNEKTDLRHDLGADSLDFTEIVFALEAGLDVSVNAECGTVGELIDVFYNELKKYDK